jgi:serine protease AprX
MYTFGQLSRRSYQVTTIAATLFVFVMTCISVESNTNAKPSHADIIRDAAAQGKLAFKLTEPNEIKSLLGAPATENIRDGGGMEILTIGYPGIEAIFGRLKKFTAPFTLLALVLEGKRLDIGEDRQIVLRDDNDLKKFDAFNGLAGLSLVELDLRKHKELLDKMPFDSLTVWPEPNKMPEGFEPARLLEEGKNPGLGIRNLHEKGIDGRNVGLAIIDQPLVRNHRELRDNIVRFEDIDVQNIEPQMHGPGVSSIAVGKTCGVAPGASLIYYAVPTWKWRSCRPYCDVIVKILELNKILRDSEKIRVVSISQGMFSQWSDFVDWKKVVERAACEGVLIVPCGTTLLNYGTLTRIIDKDPDEPTSYRCGKYGGADDSILVPAGNRTIASHNGPEVYKFEREGGMSWAAPYLAGLAALAYQVNPEIKPDQIVKLWLETATKTDAGPVVNPVGFVEAVQKIHTK